MKNFYVQIKGISYRVSCPEGWSASRFIWGRDYYIEVSQEWSSHKFRFNPERSSDVLKAISEAEEFMFARV